MFDLKMGREKIIYVVWVYSFPIAAVTNYHKLSGFNNTNLLSLTSGGWKWILLARIKTPAGPCSF